MEPKHREEQREEMVLAAFHLDNGPRSVLRLCCTPDLGLPGFTQPLSIFAEAHFN